MAPNATRSDSISLPIVHLVDDDNAVLDALSMLLDSVNIPHKSYPTAIAFFDNYSAEEIAQLSGCMVLDIRMPGMSGIESQRKLKELHCTLPIIFLSGHGDVPMAVEAMKNGAIEFFQKPFREQALLDCIQHTLESNQLNQSEKLKHLEITQRIATLTSRERQVMAKVVAGQANKVIASDLTLSQRTIEIHRANMMEKMQAKSLAELVKMVLAG